MQREGLNVSLQILDVTMPESIHETARRIHRDFGRLNILVNNAGTVDSRDTLVSEVPEGAVRHVMETNFYGALKK
ncbi:hypothetical protein CTI14_43955 [Methylobacterium radiotolerans]|nr:hypothetical protein CTI14_43955 [Methylobacterium radiotolerans]